MSNKNILGGFLGDTNSLVQSSAATVPSGKYSVNEITKLRYRNSWPSWVSDSGRGLYFSTVGSATTNITSAVPSATHVFVICAGGGGSGAADNDCQGQGPGGSGGFGKALVSLSAVGSNTANMTIGSGGPGVSGNDVDGSSGNLSSITIGNFSMTANAGNGGLSKNGGGASGNSGNCNVSGPNLSFSTTNVFYSPLIGTILSSSNITYQTVQTNVSGSGGGCGGGGSGPGTSGFIYLRFGVGINASTTLTPSIDFFGGGNSSPYTPSY
jgi:hypothetical protein